MGSASVAASQMKYTWDIEKNTKEAESLIARAATKNAQMVLLHELFLTL
ncbi:MAG: nitrilase-related carbon-nitrogen hydrolase [Pseudomonadota bacterium]|nr:nitrilase-related carbon-nitrogen hydrolase [Pseudomonadota bacterium]